MYTRFPLRYLLPNAATALNIALAGVAIALGHLGRYELAAWAIVWCVLLDRADGAIARMFDARSEFGGHFDTLADFLAFCAAPASLVFFFLSSDPRYKSFFAQPLFETGLIVSALLYLVAGAVRLARFNATADEVGPDWFQGLTSTFAGFIIATYLLSAEHYSWPFGAVAAIPLLLLLCAALMMSDWPLPKSLRSEQQGLFPLLVFLHAVVYVLGIFTLYPGVLLALALAYPVAGFYLGARTDYDLKASLRGNCK